MRYVEVETQGESRTAIVNTEHVAYLAESIYGTSIHFVSGEYIICLGDVHEIANRLFEGEGKEDYLIEQSTRLE